MKMYKKHLLPVVLFLMICLLALPMSAMAASKSTPAAMIGNKSYATLQAALKAVGKNQTIKLMRDVTANGYIKADRNVSFTLDLNKKTLKEGYDEENDIIGTLLISKGNITIQNGTISADTVIGKNAVVTLKNCKANSVNSSGKLTVKSGTYGSLDNRGTAKIENGKITYIEQSGNGKMTIENVTSEGLAVGKGTVTIKGGKFNLDGDSSITIDKKATLNIEGGTFTSAVKSESDATSTSCLIFNEGTLSIRKGTLKTSGYMQVIMNLGSAKLNISGGMIQGGHADYPTIRVDSATVKITGGTITNTKGSVITMNGNHEDKIYGKLIISGGKIQCTSKTAAAIGVEATKKNAASKISVKSGCVTAKSKKTIEYDSESY
jgi:hypothetical protein